MLKTRTKIIYQSKFNIKLHHGNTELYLQNVVLLNYCKQEKY